MKGFLGHCLLLGILFFVTCICMGVPLEEQYSMALEQAREEYLLGNIEESAYHYSFAMDVYPLHEETYLELGAMYREKGDFNRSREYLEKGLATIPDNHSIRAELIRIMVLQRDIEGALNLITTETSHRDLLFYSGVVLMQLGEYHEASTLFTKAIDVDDHFSAGIYLLARTYQELGMKEKAVEKYRRAVELDRSFDNVYPILGDLYYELGKMQEAHNAYGRTPASLRDDHVQARLRELASLLAPPPPDEPWVRKERTISFREVDPVEESFYTLRIALMTQAQKVEFQAGSDFIISRNNVPLFRGEAKTTYILINSSDGLRLLDFDYNPLLRVQDRFRLDLMDDRTTLCLFNMEYGQGYFWAGQEDRQYRGSFIVDRQDSRYFHLINEIGIEEYLYSVVPSEMPASWPLEALKAQAIAARSYTIHRYERNQDADYHLLATIMHASYRGVTWEHTRSIQAVDATRGVVATYNGRAIDAVYSANSGGHTEDASFVWGWEIPYLQGVKVGEIQQPFPLTPHALDEWLRNPAPSYSLPQQYGSTDAYRWTRILLPHEPPVTARVGNIIHIEPQERSQVGSVSKVKVIGEEGETILSGDTIRSQLGGLKSNRFIVEPVFLDDTKPTLFILWGGGWGHSVGLDQTGSAGMAEAGYSHEEILSHFYQGISLESWY